MSFQEICWFCPALPAIRNILSLVKAGNAGFRYLFNGIIGPACAANDEFFHFRIFIRF
jgi:hypothetical protein